MILGLQRNRLPIAQPDINMTRSERRPYLDPRHKDHGRKASVGGL